MIDFCTHPSPTSPCVDLINAEEQVRILELIEANTWPERWTGTEPLASEFEEPRDVVQLSFDCGWSDKETV